MKNRRNQNFLMGFTPLEKGSDFQADGGFSLEANPPLEEKPSLGLTVKGRSSLTGFTLIEILISVTIMAVAITSTLQILIYLIQMQEANDTALLCMNVAQGYLDEVRIMNYEDIVANCNNKTFSLNELTNRNIQHLGVAYAQEIEAGYLTEVKGVICYKVKNRIYGEDKNFNGLLDAGEDENGNGQIDSPCSVSAVIANR